MGAAVALALAVVGFPVYYLTRSGSKNPTTVAVRPDTAAPASTEAVSAVGAPAQAPAAAGKVATEAARPVPRTSEARTPATSGASPTPTTKTAALPSAVPETPAPQTSTPVASATPQPPPTTTGGTAAPQLVTPASPSPATQIPAPTLVHEPPILAVAARGLPTLPPPERSAVNEPANPAPAVSRQVKPAVAIQKVAPVYPEIAKTLRMKATVVIELDIDERGKVVKATPVSGPALLHPAAQAAVLKWRFEPASLNGTNVSSQGRVSMFFKYP